jgi:hypothetical protein
MKGGEGKVGFCPSEERGGDDGFHGACWCLGCFVYVILMMMNGIWIWMKIWMDIWMWIWTRIYKGGEALVIIIILSVGFCISLFCLAFVFVLASYSLPD